MTELKRPCVLQLRHNNSEGFVYAYEVGEMNKYLSEVDKVLAEKEADYKEACDRLKTANLIKDEQKARIAELEKENQTLAEDVSDKIESITELMELVEKYKSQKAELEEELEASKRKEKESRELADPYTLYCEASAESLRNALGEYRWRRPCDERPPEWSCVIVYFHDEESRDEQYRLAVYSKENGWVVDDEEVYKTAEIDAWHPLPMPPEEEQ